MAPPRCSRGAKMAPEGAPEVPKWLPECQKGGMAIPRSHKGPAAEGVALKILISYPRFSSVYETDRRDFLAPFFSELVRKWLGFQRFEIYKIIIF